MSKKQYLGAREITEDILSTAIPKPGKLSGDLRRRIRRIGLQAQKRQRNAFRSGWLASKKMCRNPLLVRLTEVLETQAKEARQCALDHAAEIVGRIAEEKSILSSTSILFVVTAERTIKATVMYNAARQSDWEISIDDAGIVPLVARTGAPYLAADTDQERLFIPENAHTRCELAIPVQFENEVIGVLNLESETPQAFTPATLEYVQERVADLVPHLLVLRAIETRGKRRCPWHPFVHGWDLRKIFQRLCDGFADELGREATKCTIWYLDKIKEELFAYATYGYDWAFRDEKGISTSGGRLDRFIDESSGPVIIYTPADESFVDYEKARSLKLETGLMTSFYSAGGSGSWGGEKPEVVGLVNVYLNEVEFPEIYGDRKMVVSNALPEVARIVQELIAAYVRERVSLAKSVLQNAVAIKNKCTLGALLERWIFKVCEVFQSPAASLYGVDAGGDLVCLASTGFRRVIDGKPFGIDERDPDVAHKRITLDQPLGHTAVAFNQKGRSLRRNRLGFPGEKGIPQSCPECGGRSTPEFICGEQYQAGEQSKRRFLACAIMDGDMPIGVLRIVRQEVSHPFTQCEERMIESICQSFAALIKERIEDGNNALIFMDGLNQA